MRYLLLLTCFAAPPAFADAPRIAGVTATPKGDGYRFDVTISHADTGWDHYADGWDVRDTAGTVLGHRILAHPHVNEHPFTRSLPIENMENTSRVFVFAKDNLGEWSRLGFEVILP